MNKLTSSQISDMRNAIIKVNEIDNALSYLGDRKGLAEHWGQGIHGAFGHKVLGYFSQEKLGQICVKAIIEELVDQRATIIEPFADTVEFPPAPSMKETTDD